MLDYKEIDIEDYNDFIEKPILYEKDNGYPIERLDPFVFEDITYFAIKQYIQKEGAWEGFDKISSLGGIRDKGRDCLLIKNERNLGIIQCKHSSKFTALSKTKFAKELIKFLLYSIKFNDLISDIKNFKYYIFSSAGLSSQAKKLLENFNSDIFKEPNFEKWVNDIINQHSTIRILKDYSNIQHQINPLLKQIKVKELLTKDFDLLLSKDYNSNLVAKFFTVKLVIDAPKFEKILKKTLSSEINYSEATSIINSASFDLECVNNYFGNNSNTHVERNETEVLLNWVLQDLPLQKKGIAVLEADAGLGKTVVLKELSKKVKNEGIPVLSIKADKYYAKNRIELEKKLFQKSQVSFEDIIFSILKKEQKFVVIIDQLDALSQTLSTERDYLITYNRIIRDLLTFPEIRVIISVRSFDLNFDSDLKIYKSKDSTLLKLSLLTVQNVKNVLSDFKISTNSENFLELLRVPRNLNIYSKLKFKRNYNVDLLKSVNDLNQALWDEIIDESKSKNLKVKQFLYILSKRMYELQQITVANTFKDDYIREVNFLKSRNIVSDDRNGLQFFHQSFYDYVFSKQFVDNGESLIRYIDKNGQSLYVRQIIKMVLEFLRETNHRYYLITIGKILKSSKYRFHIKMLLVSTFSFTNNPTLEEKAFFKSNILPKIKYFEVFMTSVLSEGWINYLINENVLLKQLKPKENKILKIFLKSKMFSNIYHALGFTDYDNEYESRSDMVYRCLRNNLHTSQVEITNFLISLPDDYNGKINLTYNILINLNDWNSTPLDLFKNTFQYKYSSNNRHDNFWYFQVLNKISKSHPDFVLNELEPIISRIFKNLEFTSGLDYDEKKILEDLSKTYPSKLFKFLFKIMVNATEEHKFDSSMKDINSPLYKGYYFSDVGIKSSVMNADEEIFEFLKNHIVHLSISRTSTFFKFFNKYKDANSIPILKLLAYGLLENTSTYSSQIFEFILLLQAKNIFNSYDDRFQFLLRKLIGRTFESFSDNQKDLVISLLLNISHPQEKIIFNNDGKKEHILHFYGKKKYLFINEIPIDEIHKNPRLKKIYRELKRKFGDIKSEPMDESRMTSYSVGAPYDDAVYKNMNHHNWKDSMKKFDGTENRKRFEDPTKGGIFEHMRAFEKSVSENPIEFGDFISTLINDNEIDIGYALSGLSGLINGRHDPKLVFSLYKKLMAYKNLDRSNILQLIWNSNYLIENKLIDEDIFEFLADLAINHPNPNSPMNSDDPSFDSLNTVRGAAVTKIIRCYYNKSLKAKIFEVVEKASKDPQQSVRVAVLLNLAYLNSLDLDKSFKIFCEIVNTDEIQVLKNSMRAAVYFKNAFFTDMNDYFNKILDKEELHENGVKIIASAYLAKNEKEGSHRFLERAMGLSEKSSCAIISTAEEFLYLENKLNIKSYQLLIKMLEIDGDDISNRFSGLILRKFKTDNFLELLSFLKEYVQSSHARKLPKYFFDYLIKSSGDYPVHCLKLMEKAIYFENNDVQKRGYFDKEPLQVILSIYSSLNKDFNANKKHLEKTLDLFDILLQNPRLRKEATLAIDSL